MAKKNHASFEFAKTDWHDIQFLDIWHHLLKAHVVVDDAAFGSLALFAMSLLISQYPRIASKVAWVNWFDGLFNFSMSILAFVSAFNASPE